MTDALRATARDAGTLPIAETFTSIQGEGKLGGLPSHFIRVSGCNLRCAWCDTPYASWSPGSTTRTIADLAAEAAASRAGRVVLTGGEPMLFDAITPLARLLRGRGLHVTIETAGTIDRDAPCDLLSLSPKLSNSTPSPGDPRDPGGVWRARHESRRTNAAALRSLLDRASERHADRQIKFVVTSHADLSEIDRLLGDLGGWRPEDIFLMPEGVVPPPVGATDWIVAACLDRGWRYGRRLHIDLFGNRRGT